MRCAKIRFVHREPQDGEVLEGNDRYEGYSVDLIDSIAKILGFKYQFVLSPKNSYGAIDKETGKWNGLVQLILERVRRLICTFRLLDYYYQLINNYYRSYYNIES